MTVDPLQAMIENVIANLPNFLGLVLALLVVLRQNIKLTDTLVQLIKDCDCGAEPNPKE
jgi:hypothetical protein